MVHGTTSYCGAVTTAAKENAPPALTSFEMMVVPLVMAALVLVETTAHASLESSLTCFVKYSYSNSTTKNMCERAFYMYPEVSDAISCADKCVADTKCIMFAWELHPQGPQCRLSATCKTPTNALPGFVGYFRNSTAGECTPKQSAVWERVFLDSAAAKGGVCLDGTPGAYYIRRKTSFGVPADPEKWIVFMQGGGWCASDQNCLSRAGTGLGSSKSYPPVPVGMEGQALFDDIAFVNHTVVYQKYCDGGSFSGSLSNPPVKVRNGSGGMATIYYRGRGIFDGLMDQLLDVEGMHKAKTLLYAGCSAGGLTTYMHADYVTSIMAKRAPSAKVVALADAMFSLDHRDVQNDTHWREFMSFVYSMDPNGDMNNEACVVAMADKYGVPKGNRSEGWRCNFGASVAPFVRTPLFVLNSKFDTWQGKQIIRAGNCAGKIASCPKDTLDFWSDYGREMRELAAGLPPRHGVFLHNCQSHCQTSPGIWDQFSVDGTRMDAAFREWYFAALAGTQADVPRHIDNCSGVLPCANDACPRHASARSVPGRVSPEDAQQSNRPPIGTASAQNRTVLFWLEPYHNLTSIQAYESAWRQWGVHARPGYLVAGSAYAAKRNGSLGYADTTAGEGKDGVLMERYGFPALHRLGLKVLAMVYITHYEAIAKIVAQPGPFIEQLIAKAEATGVHGFDFDYEPQQLRGDVALANSFIEFLKQTADTLRSHGLMLTIDIGGCRSFGECNAARDITGITQVNTMSTFGARSVADFVASSGQGQTHLADKWAPGFEPANPGPQAFTDIVEHMLEMGVKRMATWEVHECNVGDQPEWLFDAVNKFLDG